MDSDKSRGADGNSPMDDFVREIKLGFLDEVTQNLEEIETSFLALESNHDDREALRNIFRIFHNFKGSANAVQFLELGAFAHLLESFLLKVKNGEFEVNSEVINLLLKSKDHIESLVTILRTDLNASTDCSELTQQVNAYIANIGSRSKSSPTASNSSASHVGRVQSNASKPQQSKSTVPIATTVPRDAGIVAPSNTEQQDQSTQESPSEPAVFETSQYDASLSVGARSFNLDEPNAMDSVKAGDRYMIFSIVGLEFGFPLNLVREVSALPKITPISGESQEVLGVYNLRGEVIPVIDLKKKMGYPPSLAKEPVVIVCDIGRHRIGMLVDNVNSVLSLDPTEIADPRAILQTRTRDIVDFVLKRDKKPILILNLKRTLNLD